MSNRPKIDSVFPSYKYICIRHRSVHNINTKYCFLVKKQKIQILSMISIQVKSGIHELKREKNCKWGSLYSLTKPSI